MNLRESVERYVALKRHLGWKYRNNEHLLVSWANYAMGRGEQFVRAETAVRWSSLSASADWARTRLSVVRRFAVRMHSEDARNEVPHRDTLGRVTRRRPRPHPLTDTDIVRLMAAALQLPPPGSITPHTLYCAIGLMAATGLRRCEVCALRFADIGADGLTIRETKFRKSRLVPLHPTVGSELGKYLDIRQRIGGPDDHVFVLSSGRAINPDILSGMFVKLARAAGLRGGPGEPGPRLHDLRHRFAVTSLEQAVSTGRDGVNRHILALATYLGHTNVSSTHWYLEATPVLLRQIAQDTESAHGGRMPT